jgi:hypothetical protein
LQDRIHVEDERNGDDEQQVERKERGAQNEFVERIGRFLCVQLHDLRVEGKLEVADETVDRTADLVRYAECRVGGQTAEDVDEDVSPLLGADGGGSAHHRPTGEADHSEI